MKNKKVEKRTEAEVVASFSKEYKEKIERLERAARFLKRLEKIL